MKRTFPLTDRVNRLAAPSFALAAVTLALGVLALAGCGTTTLSGGVGQTLSGGGISATVERVDLRPPVLGGDITGLSSPTPGNRLVAARVRLCSKSGAAIGPYDFGIALAGGGHGTLKYPAHNYAETFDTVRAGCGAGWIVFQIPRSSTPAAVHFGFDDSGQAAPGGFGGRAESHERFTWRLG